MHVLLLEGTGTLMRRCGPERHLVGLLALTQTQAFSGVTTKQQSPGSLLSHAKIIIQVWALGSILELRYASPPSGPGIPALANRQVKR